MKKMNNKGFSLVELIVVVLIMAIIAVALAPQVMKWVENSRKSTDCNNYDSVVSAVNLALADEQVLADVGTNDGYQFTWDKDANNKKWACKAKHDGSGAAVTLGSSATANIGTKLNEILGDTWVDDMVIKRTTSFTGTNGTSDTWTITVKGNGTVERTNAPSAKDVS